MRYPLDLQVQMEAESWMWKVELRGEDWAVVIYLKSWDATELFLSFSFLPVKLYSLALALQVSFRSPPTFLFSEEMGRNVFR